MAERPTKQSFSRLLTDGTKLTVATLVAGLLGYVFQALMGRLLCDSNFATFSSLNSMTMVIASPLAALVMLIARRVAILESGNQRGHLLGLYQFWQIRTAIGFCCLGTLLAINISAVETFFKTDQPIAIWLFFGVIAVNALVSINAAFLHGMHRFTLLSGLSITLVLLKISIATVLATRGDCQLQGALAGMLTASLITWATGSGYLHKLLLSATASSGKVQFNFTWMDSLSVLAATVGFTILCQIDVPLANFLFPPMVASSYAAAAVLGKAVLYLPGGLSLALFPMIAGTVRTHQQNRLALLRYALVTTMLLCSATATCYSLLGEFIIGALYGNRYPFAGPILAVYGWTMLPLSLTLVLQTYLLAIPFSRIRWILGFIGLAVLCVFTITPPNTPHSLLQTIGGAGLAFAAPAYLFLARSSPSHDAEKPRPDRHLIIE